MFSWIFWPTTVLLILNRIAWLYPLVIFEKINKMGSAGTPCDRFILETLQIGFSEPFSSTSRTQWSGRDGGRTPIGPVTLSNMKMFPSYSPFSKITCCGENGSQCPAPKRPPSPQGKPRPLDGKPPRSPLCRSLGSKLQSHCSP